MTKRGDEKSPRLEKIRASGLVVLVLLFVLAHDSPPAGAARINDTKHNLSVTGPGPIKASSENRICIFCHTPHNGNPNTPLWNKELNSQNYQIYTGDASSPPPVIPNKPYGPTKLCLSCHDGTVALGSVLDTGTTPNGSGTRSGVIAMNAASPGLLSNFGTDLSNHHPVVFSYPQAQALDTTGQLADLDLLPPELTLGGPGNVHCTTCHEPHDNTYGDFLVMDNRFSALCTACHRMSGWQGSGHATSAAQVGGILPRPPKTFPSWPTLSEWGCEVCHTPHFAATPQKLLNFSSSPVPPYTYAFDCTTGSCHSSTSPPYHSAETPRVQTSRADSNSGASVDIKRQLKKRSSHAGLSGESAMTLHQAKRESAKAAAGVSCVDCHNPHSLNGQKASPPNVSGMLKDVAGVDAYGMEIRSARYEYEVCLKCHGDYNSDIRYVRRVVNTMNARAAFSESNPSYHPVIAIGKARNVPSIPSPFEPSGSSTDLIYCTDCHRDDQGGSRGPHGSSFAPILRERYEAADNTQESYESYALCYRCHNRTSILADDSFKKNSSGKGGHSGHLAAGAPCSACHDPHGVNDLAQSGSHTHLINFDTTIVLPKPGNPYPLYSDRGAYSGSCTLLCHGKLHDNEGYPQGRLMAPAGLGRSNSRRSR